MEEKELICEYCKVSIKETDHKCPNCGANCTHVINEYKKQKRAKEEEVEQKRREMSANLTRDIDNSFKKVAIVIFSIVAIFILLIASVIYSQVRNSRDTFDNFGNFDDEEKVVTGKYQKEVKSNKIGVTLDSYEFYEHKTDKFPDDMEDNTKPGYQKIAFHFIIKNNTKSVFDTSFDAKITLTADDYKVDKADLEKCYTCYTVTGKDSYQNLYDEIAAGEKLQGYAGFLVPKDKKNLKFKVGDNIVITMDNPAYNG